MGIQDLTKHLKSLAEKEAPTSKHYDTYPITTLKGKSVAIDTCQWFRGFWVKSYADILRMAGADALNNYEVDNLDVFRVWIVKCMYHLRMLRHYEIKPYLILEGKAPIEKMETQQERAAVGKSTMLRMEAIKNELLSEAIIDWQSPKFIAYINGVSNLTSPSKENWATFAEFAKAEGFTVLQSVTESERLASLMCFHGIVDAVFSSDSDCLVYGVPLLVTKIFNDTDKVKKYNCYRLERVLKLLDFDFNTFREFCISIGCDYNKRLYRCGPVKAYNYFKQYGRYSNFPDDLKEKTLCWKMGRCLELFDNRDWRSDCAETQGELDQSKDAYKLSLLSQEYGIHGLGEYSDKEDNTYDSEFSSDIIWN